MISKNHIACPAIGEAEQEEPEGEVAATSNEQASQPILANINRQRSEDAVSKDGTASQCSVRSIGVESTGYLSDDEGDDDYIHIFNTEYSFSDRESDDGDRASFRSFRWSSSKQSLTSLLETVSEEAPLADEASEIAEEENASQHQSALHLEPDIEKKDLEILYASSVSVSQDKTFEFTESDGEFVRLSKPSHTDASLGNAEVQTFSLMTTDPVINDSNNNGVVIEAHKPKIEPKKPQFFIKSESSFTCLEIEGLFLEKVTECDENEIPESYRACIRSNNVTQDPVEEESILEIIIQEESESKTDKWRTTRNEETSPSLASFDSFSSTANEMFSAREDYLQPEGFGMECKSSKRCCLEEREEKILHTHEDYQILEMVTVEARKDRSELRNKHEEKPTLDEVTAKHEDCKEHNVKRLEQDKENKKEDKENKHGCDNDVNVDYKGSNAEQETRTSCVESLEVVELLPIMPEKYVIERREEKKTIGQNEGLSKIENKRAEEQLVREDCFSTEATYDKGETNERYTQFEQKMQTNGDKITKKEGSKEWVHSGVAGNQKAFYFCKLQEIPLERYAAHDMIDKNEEKGDMHIGENMNTKDQCTTIEVEETELENGNHATHFMVDRLNKFDDEKIHNIFKERKAEEACKEEGRKIAKISENQDLTQMGSDEVCELQPKTVENMQVMKYDDSNSLHEKKTVKHSLQRKKEEKIEEERCLELPLVTEKERTMVEKFSQCRNEIPHCQESNKDTDNFDDKETKKLMKMELSTDKDTSDETIPFHRITDMSIEEYLLFCTQSASEKAPKMNERQAKKESTSDKGTQDEADMTIEDYLMFCSAPTSEERKCTEDMSTDKGTQDKADMTIEDYILLCSTPTSEEATETKERKCTEDVSTNKGFQEETYMTIEDYLLLCSTSTSEEATATKEWKYTKELSTDKGTQEEGDMTIEDYLLLCSTPTSEEATETKERKFPQELSKKKGAQEEADVTFEDYEEYLSTNKGSEEEADMTIEDYLLLSSTPPSEEATETKERKCTKELSTNKGSQEEADMTIEDYLLLCSKPTSEEATNTKKRKCTEELSTNKGSQEEADMTIEDYLLLCSTPTSEEAKNTKVRKCTEDFSTSKGSQEEDDMTIEGNLLLCSTTTSEEATDTKERKCTEELSRYKGSQEGANMTIEEYLLLCSTPISEEATKTSERQSTEKSSTDKDSQEDDDMIIEDCLLLCSTPAPEQSTKMKGMKFPQESSKEKGIQEEADMTIEDYLLLFSTSTSEEATERKEWKYTKEFSKEKGAQEEADMAIEEILLLCSTPTSEEATETKERECTEKLRTNKGTQDKAEMTIEDHLLLCTTATSEEATERKEWKYTKEFSKEKGAQEEADMAIEEILLLCTTATSEEATETKERKFPQELSKKKGAQEEADVTFEAYEEYLSTNKGSEEEADMTIEDYLLLCSTPPSEEATETKERKCTEELSTNKGSQEEADMTIEDYLLLCSKPTSEEATNTKERKCTEELSTNKGSQEEADMTIEDYLLLCSTPTSEEAKKTKVRKCTEDFSTSKGSQEEADMTIEDYLLLCSAPTSEERKCTEDMSTDKGTQDKADMTIEDYILLCSTPTSEEATDAKERKCTEELSSNKDSQEEPDMTIEDYLLICSTPTSEEATNTKERKCTEEVSTKKGSQEEGDMTIEDYLLFCSTPTTEEATDTKERKCTEELSSNKGSQEEPDMTIEDYLLIYSTLTSVEATDTKERKCTEELSRNKGSQEEGDMTIEDCLLLCSKPTSEEATNTKERKCTEDVSTDKGFQDEADMTIEDYLLLCTTATSLEATETKERKFPQESSKEKGTQEEADMTIKNYLLLCSTSTTEEATKTKDRQCTEKSSANKDSHEKADMTNENYLLLCSTATPEPATKMKEMKYPQELSKGKCAQEEADMTIEENLLLCSMPTSEEATETKETKFPQELSKGKGAQNGITESQREASMIVNAFSTPIFQHSYNMNKEQSAEDLSTDNGGRNRTKEIQEEDMTREGYIHLCSKPDNENESRKNREQSATVTSIDNVYRIQIINAQEEAGMTIGDHLLRYSKPVINKSTKASEGQLTEMSNTKNVGKDAMLGSQGETEMFAEEYSNLCLQKVAERKSEEQSPLQAISSNLFSKDINMSLTDKKDPIQDCVELYSYNMAENALQKNEIRSWDGSSKPKKDELLFENVIKEFVPEIREGEDMQSIDGGWWKKDGNTVIREGHEGDLNSKEKLMTEAEEGRTKAQNMADKDKGDKTTEARKRKASTGSLVESGTLTELVQKRKGSKEECKRFSTCEEDTVRETIKNFEQLRKYEESSIKNYTESFPHSGHTQRKHSASEMGKTDLLTIEEEVRHNQENTLCKEVSDSKVPPDEDITPWMHASQSVRGTYSEAKKNKGSGSNWSNDQGDLLLHAKILGKRLNDEDTNDKEAIMRLPSFSVLEGDLEDFSQLSRASPCLRIEESINTSVSEKELATNSYEQHNNVPKDENNSEIGHVKITSNICEQPCLDNKKHQISEQPLNKIEQDTKENRKSPGALLEKTGKESEKIPEESSKTTEVVFYSPAFGNCKEHSFIQPVQIGGEFNIRGSIFSREECGVSSYQLDLKPIESLPEQYELRQTVKKIFFIGKIFYFYCNLFI